MSDGAPTEIALHIEPRPPLSERAQTTVLLGKPNKEIVGSQDFQVALPQLKEAFSQSGVWHGTGRFQYDPGDRSKVRDVLETIVAEDGLVPHRDVLDFTQGEMQSVSTSPAWLYSFMYAQYHYEIGKSFFGAPRNTLIWSYYLAPMFHRTLKETFVRKNPSYTPLLDRETRQAFQKSAEGFHDKATKEKPGNKGMVKGGVSDIPGNYPVLIGIKEGAFQPRAIAGALDKHEIRSPDSISISNFTHIEVPLDKVEEVRSYLEAHGRNIPVYPIEFALEAAKQLPTSSFLDGQLVA